eukprot:EG_transcript_8050
MKSLKKPHSGERVKGWIRGHSPMSRPDAVQVNVKLVADGSEWVYPKELLGIDARRQVLIVTSDGARPAALKNCLLLAGARLICHEGFVFAVQDARKEVVWEVKCSSAEVASCWVQRLEEVWAAPPVPWTNHCATLRGLPSLTPTIDLCYWMAQCRESLQSRRLIDLAMPGSHDSATYGLDMQKEFIPCYKGLPKGLQKFVKRDAVDWSRAQRGCLADQLQAGCRYFDLRIAVDPATGQFWTCHGLFSNPFPDVLKEIADFLQTYRNEVVILDFQELHESGCCFEETHSVTHTTALAFTRLLTDVLGPLLVPFGPRLDLTLGDLWATPHRVIAVHNHPTKSALPAHIWPRDDALRSHWKDKADMDGLFIALGEEVERQRPQGKFWVLQAVLTPTPGSTIKARIPGTKEPTSLLDCANLCRPQLLYLLISDWADKGLGVVMTDMCEDPVLNEVIVRLNFPQRSFPVSPPTSLTVTRRSLSGASS